jgi:hypothetical protein
MIYILILFPVASGLPAFFLHHAIERTASSPNRHSGIRLGPRLAHQRAQGHQIHEKALVGATPLGHVKFAAMPS